jgi:pimeloyl-ACP methyl ester carboxylesterase
MGLMPFVTIKGHRLEYQLIAASAAAAPTLILLHEGLGSLAQWRDFPARLAQATGCATLVYSRLGYGQSDALTEARRVDYMHVEALETLPALRDALAIADPILVGHSDGASIALVHAGARRWPVRGLILEAPHVFVEDVTVASIAAAKEAYRTSDLRARLGRYHRDVDGAFRGWNDIWLDPEFRAWNIEDYLPAITRPVLVIQGEDDEYGTSAQLDAIREKVAGTVETLLLKDCKHSPHRDQPDATLAAMTRFVAAILAST